MLLTKFIKSEITIDMGLLKRIKRYRLLWANKNENRINFLANPHIGVWPIRFLPTEEEDFFDTVVKLNKDYARKEMIKLKDIDKDRKVTSNVFYLTCITLMSIIEDDKDFSNDDKDNAIGDLFMLMSYRFLTSMTERGFSYDLSLDLAETVYEQMSGRFIIKKTGSWDGLLQYRAKDFEDGGIYNKRLKRAKNKDLVKLIAAIRTRLADHFQEQYAVIISVKEQENKRLTTTKVKEGEDTEFIMESENLNREYQIFAKTMVPIRSEFIDYDIIDIVVNSYTRVNREEFIKVLMYMTDHYLDIKDMDKIINSIMKANIDYIYGDKLYPPYDKRILKIILHCKGLWSASRVKNKDVIFVKKELKKLLVKITGKKTEWLITPLIMAIVMYVFVKTIIQYKR